MRADFAQFKELAQMNGLRDLSLSIHLAQCINKYL